VIGLEKSYTHPISHPEDGVVCPLYFSTVKIGEEYSKDTEPWS